MVDTAQRFNLVFYDVTAVMISVIIYNTQGLMVVAGHFNLSTAIPLLTLSDTVVKTHFYLTGSM